MYYQRQEKMQLIIQRIFKVRMTFYWSNGMIAQSEEEKEMETRICRPLRYI